MDTEDIKQKIAHHYPGSIEVKLQKGDVTFVDNIRSYSHEINYRVERTILLFCVAGSMQMSIAEERILLRRGHLIVLTTGAMVTDCLFSTDFEGKALVISNEVLQMLMHAHQSVWNHFVYIEKERVICFQECDRDLAEGYYAILRSLIQDTEELPFWHEMFFGVIFSFCTWLCGIIHRQTGLTEEALQEGDSYFGRFLHLIEQEEVKYKPVKYYASKLSITPKYLSSLCKRESGKSASQWIQDYVRQEIQYYLRTTNKSIKEIGYMLGFPNTSFFGKYVKDQLGMTPTAFRNLRPGAELSKDNHSV